MYQILNKNTFSLGNYKIVPFRKEDLYLIKDWRNTQIDILRQAHPLTDQDQLHYYTHTILPSFIQKEPKILLFSYLLNDVCIGYGGLVHTDFTSKRAEVSFLAATERTKNTVIYETDFTNFLALIKMVAFEDLKLNRLCGETYDIRPLHIAILEKSGFVLEGRMREYVLINNVFVDSLIHGYLKKEYEANKL